MIGNLDIATKNYNNGRYPRWNTIFMTYFDAFDDYQLWHLKLTLTSDYKDRLVYKHVICNFVHGQVFKGFFKNQGNASNFVSLLLPS